MSRAPDKPGVWRVRPQADGKIRVSGMKKTGERFKEKFSTQSEADTWIALNLTNTPVDDWGLPVPEFMTMSPESATKAQTAAGIPPAPSGPTEEEKKKAEEDKKKRNARAASLMELVGMGYAGGVCIVSRNLTSRTFNKEPVKPNPKQVNELADVTKETITEWFGDREIKPWQMMLLLTFGIPLSMILQSPKREAKRPDLKSVPK